MFFYLCAKHAYFPCTDVSCKCNHCKGGSHSSTISHVYYLKGHGNRSLISIIMWFSFIQKTKRKQKYAYVVLVKRL